MSTTPNTQTTPATTTRSAPPLHPIEDHTLSTEGRFSFEGRRFYKRWLDRMYGAFLTLLDADGKILYVAAGALRRRSGEKEDEVVLMTPAMLAHGLQGDSDGVYQPEYERIKISGPERGRQWTLILQESPALTTYLGVQIPEARHWAIMTTGPENGHQFKGHLPDGHNAEFFLQPGNWMKEDGGIIAGAGGCDLSLRLAPKALEYARTIPSAWSLMMTSAVLFGGMTENVPEVEPIQPSPVLRDITRGEVNERVTRKARLDALRIQRKAEAAVMGELRSSGGLAALELAFPKEQ